MVNKERLLNLVCALYRHVVARGYNFAQSRPGDLSIGGESPDISFEASSGLLDKNT